MTARAVIVIAALGGVSMLAYYSGVLWPPMWLLTAAAGVYGFVCGRWLRPALALGLALMFLTPGLLVLGTNTFYIRYHAIWLAMLLGAAASVRPRGWSLPPPIRLPLVTLALTTAITAAIIGLREADFTTLTLARSGVVAVGAPPVIIVEWIALTAAGVLLGTLWLDYLCAAYGTAPFRTFAVEILVPFAVGCGISALVGIYQGCVDPRFLRPGFWAILHRATGTVRDANGFGALCALWGPTLSALALWQLHRTPGVSLSAATILLTWGAVWFSGSRGAFLVALVGTAAVIAVAAAIRRTAAAWIVIGALLFGAVGVTAGWNSGPIWRIRDFGRYMARTPGLAMYEMWGRDGYGIVASLIVRDHPLTGVGPGIFHSSVRDYALRAVRNRLPPDNAQNWYRHQLAEYGLLGSVGWILWVSVIVYLLAAARRLPDRHDVTVVRWVLVAFGLVSLVSMPGQELFVGLTFFTLLFWFMSGVRVPETRIARVFEHRVAWLAMWALVLVYASVVAVQAATTMRPPFRAARYDRDYTYGFRTDLGTLHWAGKHAVTVPRAPLPWIKLTYWVNHPDANERPVAADVWINREHVVNRRLRLGERHTQYVRVPDDDRRFVLEVKVDRTFRPSDYGSSDRRDLGLAMNWEFVEAPPWSASGESRP